MELEFDGEIIHWRGPSPFHFVTVPDEPSAAIESVKSFVTYGWGAIPVQAMLPTTPVTVHLDSGTDVVILEGIVAGASTDPELIAAYDSKYTWEYDSEQYGPLTTIMPTQILAWPFGRLGRTGRIPGDRSLDLRTTVRRWCRRAPATLVARVRSETAPKLVQAPGRTVRRASQFVLRAS